MEVTHNDLPAKKLQQISIINKKLTIRNMDKAWKVCKEITFLFKCKDVKGKERYKEIFNVITMSANDNLGDLFTKIHNINNIIFIGTTIKIQNKHKVLKVTTRLSKYIYGETVNMAIFK